MDHVAFLVQERAELAQKSFESFSGSTVRTLSLWKDHSKNVFSSIIQSCQTSPLRERVIQWCHNVKKTFTSLKLIHIYDRCVHFFLTEVTRTHIYFGGMCFIFGTLIGIGMGIRIRDSVVAPHLMRAVGVNSYKGVEFITYVEDILAPQIVSSDQVLIQVKAAGVDYVDVKVAEGYASTMRNHINKYNPNFEKFPVILGRDCSGVVVAVGKDVTKLEAGDEVWACVPVYHQGTQSEFIVTSEMFVALKPPQLSFEGAAALPYSIMRVWDALVNQASLGDMSTAGKRVLIHAGATAVGCVAIQLVRAWGGHITTTVNSDAEPLAKALGADDIINYETTNFEKELKLREKYDVIFNPIGPFLSDSSLLELCKEGGIVVSSSYPKFASDTYGFFLGFFYASYIRLKYLFGKPPWLSGGGLGTLNISSDVLCHVAPLIASGQLQPVIEKAFSAQDAEVAYSQLSTRREIIGKIVLRFRYRPLSSPYQLAEY